MTGVFDDILNPGRKVREEPEFPGEGDPCPDCQASLVLRLDGECQCGVGKAPCSACEDAYVCCEFCGWEDPYNEIDPEEDT